MTTSSRSASATWSCPGKVKVETRLTESDANALEHGMEMELVIVPFRTDDNGDEVVTFAFRPVA